MSTYAPTAAPSLNPRNDAMAAQVQARCDGALQVAADLENIARVDSVQLVPDLRRLPSVTEPSISVEIKPKYGALPVSAAIHPRNRVKLAMSRYQLHQRLKKRQVIPPVPEPAAPVPYV